MIVSITTPTTIMIPVPVKCVCIFKIAPSTIGSVASIASDIAPTRPILLTIFAKKSLVGLPGLMPGMNPPFCCKFLEYSIGLN